MFRRLWRAPKLRLRRRRGAGHFGEPLRTRQCVACSLLAVPGKRDAPIGFLLSHNEPSRLLGGFAEKKKVIGRRSTIG